MKIKTENNKMTLTDAAIVQLIFGIIFAGIGIVMIFTVPFIINEFTSYISLLFIVGGGLVIAFWSRTTIVFDKNQGTMNYLRKGLLKKTESKAELSELTSIEYRKDQSMSFGGSSSRSRTSSGPRMRVTESLTLISTKTGMIPIWSETRDQGMIGGGIGAMAGGSRVQRKGQEIASFLGIPLTDRNTVAEAANAIKSAVGLGQNNNGQI